MLKFYDRFMKMKNALVYYIYAYTGTCVSVLWVLTQWREAATLIHFSPSLLLIDDHQ